MPRARDPNRDKAFSIFKKYNGNIDLVEIASQLNLPPGTVRGWKNKDNWNGTLGINTERSKPKKNVAKNNRKVVDDGTKKTLENDNLTSEQQLFCIYYSKTFNATQSYVKAYGCTYESAMASGPRLLGNVRVKEEIQRLKEIKRQQIEVSEIDLVEFHMRIAFADIGNYVSFGRKKIVDDETGMQYEINDVRLSESEQVDTQLIKEVSKNDKGAISIKLLDRCKSLEWLSDHLSIMTEEQRLRVQKLNLEISKLNGDEIDDNEDDGFIEALSGKVDEIWQDE